jgi:hypothetical protein
VLELVKMGADFTRNQGEGSRKLSAAGLHAANLRAAGGGKPESLLLPAFLPAQSCLPLWFGVLLPAADLLLFALLDFFVCVQTAPCT